MSGPLPHSTTGPCGSNEADLSSTSDAPDPMTPGKVQPGSGTGRSIAPEASST